MNKDQLRKNVDELIDKNKWRDILARFVDVLKINILMVDFEGQVLLSPANDRYGWNFFEKSCLGLNVPQADGRQSHILDKFVASAEYAECKCESGLHSFLVPVKIQSGESIAYMIVGPVVLNQKQEDGFYRGIAQKLNFDYALFTDALNEVRALSYVAAKSILDLLAEVARDVIELNFEKKKLSQMRINQEALPKQVSEVAQEIYARIHLEELLVTWLDIAMKMTNTECGSIMILEEGDELLIKASRGIENKKIENKKIRLGQGISGIAAKENKSFIIHGTEGDGRIGALLKRPEIKQSIVMPLSSRNRVFGVLNLHTKTHAVPIEDGIENLQYLSKLIVAAFQSI